MPVFFNTVRYPGAWLTIHIPSQDRKQADCESVLIQVLQKTQKTCRQNSIGLQIERLHIFKCGMVITYLLHSSVYLILIGLVACL